MGKAAKQANRAMKDLRNTNQGGSKWVIFSSIAIFIVFALIVVFVVVNGNPGPTKPSAEDNPNAVTTAKELNHSPRNMQFDTFTVGVDGEPLSLTEETVANDAGVFAPANFVDREDGKTSVKIFFDPQCPICGTFEATNQKLLDQYVSEGKIVLDYNPISFLDGQSSTQYSSRATNAIACVVDQKPTSAKKFIDLLFKFQPEEGGEGLSNGAIFDLAKQAGADNKKIETCIYSKQFGPWVEAATQRTLNNDQLPNTNGGQVAGTPAIFLNGNQINVNPADGEAFKTLLDAALSE